MLTFEYISDEHHDLIKQFSCNNAEQIETFLKEEVIILQYHNTVRTRLYFDDEDNFVGFFSLYNDLTETLSKSKMKNWKLPNMGNGVDKFPALKVTLFSCR